MFFTITISTTAGTEKAEFEDNGRLLLAEALSKAVQIAGKSDGAARRLTLEQRFNGSLVESLTFDSFASLSNTQAKFGA